MRRHPVVAAAALFSMLNVSCKTTAPSQFKESSAASVPGVGADGYMTVDAMVERATSRAYWPDQTQDWREQLQSMDTPACKDFKKLIFPTPVNDDNLPEERQVLRTDAMVVVKNGVIVYENYVGPYANNHQMLHPMWSASKSFTAGFFGALMQASADAASETPSDVSDIGRKLNDHLGHQLTLETRIKEMFDATLLNKAAAFGNLTVRDFLTMAPNIQWAERYAGNVGESSIVKMLWAVGAKDMAAFAARPLTGVTDEQQFGPEGAGNKFIYSSGDAVILMRALKGIFGDAEYRNLPWKAFFDRIGMSQVAFERDPAGTFIGSSYVHTTLRDMARFGYVLLNGGYYKGQQVIQKEMIKAFHTVAPVELMAGTTEESILVEQGFYGMGFYINPDPKSMANLETPRIFSDNFYETLKKPPYSSDRFFPHMPTDMFMAAGHYGQNIMVFPQDDLLVVRMSHDREYWSKIDAMASKARACFTTDGQTLGASQQFAPPVATPNRPVRDAISTLQVGRFAIQSGLFNTLFAKELCTCMYVDKMSMADCQARDNLPAIAHRLVRFTPTSKITDPATPKTLTSQYIGLTFLRVLLHGLGIDADSGPPATARYADEKVGCVLVPAGA